MFSGLRLFRALGVYYQYIGGFIISALGVFSVNILPTH